MHERNVTTIGIDTAKNVFHLHAVNKQGKEVYQRKLSRSQLLEFLANHPVCLIAIESCSGSYHWAREFKSLATQSRLFLPGMSKNLLILGIKMISMMPGLSLKQHWIQIFTK